MRTESSIIGVADEIFDSMGLPIGSADDSEAIAFGWLGTAGATLLFLSPLPVVYNIYVNRAVRHNSHIPYLVSLPQCLSWVFYAVITPDRLQPLVTNLIGSTLQAVYLVIFLWFSNDIQKRQLLIRLTIVAVIMLTLILFTLFAVPKMSFISGDSDQARETNFVGMFCLILNIIMYASPLTVMARVIRTKSVEFMPISLTIGTFLCSSTWALYGLWVGDLNIYIPNLSGIALAFAQTVLYLWYSGLFEKKHDDFVVLADRPTEDETPLRRDDKGLVL